MRRLLVLLFAGALLAPAAAYGAWSAPRELGPVSDYVFSPGISVDARGGAQLAWTTRTQPDGAGGLPGATSVTASPADNDGQQGRTGVLHADGTTATRRRFGRTVVAGPVSLSRGVLILTTQVLGGDGNLNRFVRLRLERLDSSGHLVRATTLARGIVLADAALGTDAYGRAVVAWSTATPQSENGPHAFQDRYALRTVSVATTGKLVGRPKTLETTYAYGVDYGGQVALAVGRIGDAVIAFATAHGRTRAVDVYTRSQIGRFGRRRTAGPQEGGTELAAAITAQGRAVVVWGAQDGGEEANMPWRIRAASVSTAAGAVKRALLDPGKTADRPLGVVAAVALPDGRVAAGWSGVVGRAHPVRVAIASPEGRFAKPELLAADGAFGGLAASSDGRLLATWATAPVYDVGPISPTQAMAALRPAGATASGFGPAEPVAAPDVASPPTPAFSPDGHAVAVWAARPTGVDPAEGVGRTAVLRTAVRSP